MKRIATDFFPRSLLRAPLTLSRPLPRALLAAFAPLPGQRAHELHVFARASKQDDFAKVFVADGSDAGDLKKAIVAEFKLDAAPNRVRLLLEVGGGGAPVPLDSCEKLAGQGVLEGSKVVVEALGSYVMPVPLTFTREDVGGAPMMVADLAAASAAPVPPRPFFMTLKEHRSLLHFLSIPSAPCPRSMSKLPRMLMLTGTIKSGKSCILLEVIPRMLAAGHAAAASAPLPRRRPVIFAFTFPLQTPSDECAEFLVLALREFARGQAIQLPPRSGPPLRRLALVAADLAKGIHERGDELWLLLDELGAPLVASSSKDANAFIIAFKEMLERCWAQGAFLVCSGSGMVTLLTAVRSCPPNGFMLWSSVVHVRLGSEPPTAAAALAMARRIHAFYSSSLAVGGERAAAFITPERCLAALARASHGDTTSTRPALVAFLLASLEDADWGSRPDEEVWQRAIAGLLRKLRNESEHDAAVALGRLHSPELLALRQLADGVLVKLSGDDPGGQWVNKTFDLGMLLCEEMEEGATATPLLMPPYGALLRSWIMRPGQLAVSTNNGGEGLHILARNNLKALHTLTQRFSADLRDKMSDAVLRAMVFYGIGTPEAGDEEAGRRPGVALRAPRTVEEFVAVPGITCVMGALKAQAEEQGVGAKAPSVEKLLGLLLTPHNSQQRADYMRHAGFWALMLLRHAESHTDFPSKEAVRSGFSCAAIVAAINAAIEPPVELEGAAFSLKEGILCAVAEAPRRLAGRRGAGRGRE